jgi:hypothetical protein
VFYAFGVALKYGCDTACQSTEDRTTTVETAAATAATEQDSLASRLALAEVEVEKLRVR